MTVAIPEAMQPDRIIQRSGGIYERDIVDGWIQVLADVSNLANFIAETDFVPRSLRNRPAAVAACILTGRELGIGPMQSLKVIHMIQGVPSLSAEYKRARALAAGHDITFDETNTTRCIVRGRRAGTDRWVTIRWDTDMARRAKLDGKDVWRQYPQRMLQARASSELCDLLFPDATLGLATTEVLEDGGIVTESGEIVDAATGELTTSDTPAIEAGKPRTAQRKPRATSSPPAQAAAPSAAPEPQRGAGGDLPPLPGEDEAERRQCPEALHDPDDGSINRCQLPGGHDGKHKAGVITWGAPEPVTPKQLTAIWTVLSEVFLFGKDERDEARKVCAHIVNRDLSSSKDMSKQEAGTVLDTLAHWETQAQRESETPRAYLQMMINAARGGDGQEGGGDVS